MSPCPGHQHTPAERNDATPLPPIHHLDTLSPNFTPQLRPPGALPLVQDSGRSVFLVSGGFRQIIHPIAEQLGIPLTRVFANLIQFQVCSACRDKRISLPPWPRAASWMLLG